MEYSHLAEKAEEYLRLLCVEITSRRVGSSGNRAATDFFAHKVASFGFETISPEFDCIDWYEAGVSLTVDGASFEAFASPYSLGCRLRAPLVVVSTVEELEASDAADKIILLRGTIAKGQLMPKNFAFYNPDEHKRIISLLETKGPHAVITATSRDFEMVGSMYPFPLIEDGDFDIPTIYMTDMEGNKLAEHEGREISLESRAKRITAKGCNVVAHKGARTDRRVVLFAHVDARIGSPGAGDNASGVIVLLLLSELLADYSGNLGIEIVALNGEDYYSNPGEHQYLALNSGRFGEIILGINLDDVGFYKGKAAFSLYECPSEIAGSIRRIFSGYKDLVEGERWYQGDHGLFLINQRPTLAVTSELVSELMMEIIHTPNDKPEFVDANKLVNIALALRDLLLHIARVE